MSEILSQNSMEVDMLLVPNLEGSAVQDSSSTKNDPIVSDLSLSKTLMSDDDLKKDKDKIKRRRSSHGRCLSRRSICTNVSETNEVKLSNVTVEKISSFDLEASKSGKNSLQESERLEIKLYEERTKRLATERTAWRKLIEFRRAKLTEALRDNKDAKRGYTLMEEEDISPEIRNYIKTITLSQPDYNQYLRDINLVQEKAILTKLEIFRVTSMAESFLNLLKVYSRNSCKILEKEIFGEANNPKKILKAMQQGC